MNKFHFRQSQNEIRQKYKVQSVMSFPHVLRRSQAHGEHLPRYKTQHHNGVIKIVACPRTKTIYLDQASCKKCLSDATYYISNSL
jgi:hypothetical protein